MYIIKRNNRRFNNKLFASYETARQYIRKLLRKDGLGMLYPSSNANISDWGFKVSKV